MRICRITPTYPSDINPGIGLPSYYMTKNITYDTLLITRKRPGTILKSPEHAKIVLIPYFDSTISDKKGINKKIALLIKILGYLTFFILSIFHILKFRPHVVHIHTPMPILHAVFAKYILKSKMVITFHGTDINSLKKWSLLNILIKKSDKICYVSRSMINKLKYFFDPEKLVYTPSGVDTKFFVPTETNRDNTILMVGNLRWQKSYNIALIAFNKFLQDNPDWTLKIAGSGPLKQNLIDIAEKFNISNSVKFLGTCSRYKILELMQKSKLLLLSSKSEAFPKVILESISTGTPIVVTNVGSCAEIANLTKGEVAPPEEPEELCNAIKKLANNPEKWKKSSILSRKIALDYSWDNTSKNVINIYQSLIKL